MGPCILSKNPHDNIGETYMEEEEETEDKKEEEEETEDKKEEGTSAIMSSWPNRRAGLLRKTC